MKKLVGIVLLLLIVAVTIPADESSLFVVTKPISKIYVHRLGYRVVYVKNDMSLGDFYVPIRWFDEAGGKGVLVKGTDASYPYFEIYWEDGAFHSIILRTKSNLAHETWGNLPESDDVAQRFDIEEIEVDF